VSIEFQEYCTGGEMERQEGRRAEGEVEDVRNV